MGVASHAEWITVNSTLLVWAKKSSKFQVVQLPTHVDTFSIQEQSSGQLASWATMQIFKQQAAPVSSGSQEAN